MTHYECLSIFDITLHEKNNLKIIGTAAVEGLDTFIISDSCDKDRHIEISVSAILEQVKDKKTAQQVVDVINGDRQGQVLNGMSRIVGYYSSMKNWNSSKAKFDKQGKLIGGELLNRREGTYSTNAY